MNSRIKVLHIIKSLGRGGAEMLLPETLRLHDREKFEFQYIYFLPWKDQMVESIRRNGGEVTCFAAKNNLQLMFQARRVARFAKENNIQLIHAHLPWAGILARLVGVLTKIPVVYTEHNKQERYHVGTRTANLLTMNALSEVIAVSDDVAESIRKFKPRLKAPLRTILNGVNDEHFRPGLVSDQEVRQAHGIPADAPVVGTIAVFRFQKRLEVWLEVAAEILKRCPTAHFIIVGDGPLKSQVLKKRTALGLEAHVHFPGVKTEVRPYLAAFDIYMMSSVFEGLPIALLEAMAMECAIVTTDAGGIKEVIRHELDGLLCTTDEPMKLAGYAEQLIKDKDLRGRFRQNARKRVIDRFSMGKMVQELENMYKEVVGETRG
ncbi:MAG TPA: glycosyltransferase family 4 protein [Chryseolinea sp.]